MWRNLPFLIMKPEAPSNDKPRRTRPEHLRPRVLGIHERSEAYKDGLIEALLDEGEVVGVKFLALSRMEKRRWPIFGKLRFYGYRILIEIPGGFYVEGRGQTPPEALRDALNTPAPFRP